MRPRMASVLAGFDSVDQPLPSPGVWLSMVERTLNAFLLNSKMGIWVRLGKNVTLM